MTRIQVFGSWQILADLVAVPTQRETILRIVQALCCDCRGSALRRSCSGCMRLYYAAVLRYSLWVWVGVLQINCETCESV